MSAYQHSSEDDQPKTSSKMTKVGIYKRNNPEQLVDGETKKSKDYKPNLVASKK